MFYIEKVKLIRKCIRDVVITTKATMPAMRRNKPIAAPMKKPSRR
jgi:hypothetical protein